MNAEKIREKLEEASEKIAKLSLEKTEQANGCREFNRKHAGKDCFEEGMRERQKKLDETLILLTKYELAAVKLFEKLNVDPETSRELTENRIHLTQRAKETEKRMHTHRRRIPIPWETYEDALKDTTEKESMEKRFEELRRKAVFIRA